MSPSPPPSPPPIRAGVALLFGFIGIVVIGLAFEIQNKLVLFVIALILVFIGYFGIANRLFKNDMKRP
jgi:4-amino-4-deoxy-L-arabinose transferase-like glycosyltransferase